MPGFARFYPFHRFDRFIALCGGYPAIDRTQSGENSRVFDGAGGLQIDQPGEHDELTLMSGLDRDGEVGAGEEIRNGDAFQAERDAGHGLFGGCQGRTGGCPCPAARRVHFARFARIDLASAAQLNATVNLAVATLQLESIQQEEAAGRRRDVITLATPRKGAESFRLCGQRRLRCELCGAFRSLGCGSSLAAQP